MNPYVSDYAISRAKDRICDVATVELLKHGAHIHGGDAHGDLYRLWQGFTPSRVMAVMPATFEAIHACVDVLGCDCEPISRPYEPLTIKWAKHTVMFGDVKDVYDYPHPSVEQIYLYWFHGPTFGVYTRTVETPDIFACLDHLVQKTLIITCEEESIYKGHATTWLEHIWTYLDRGFQPQTGFTQRCIRAKISTACSLTQEMTPLIQKSLDAFYDTIPRTTAYTKPKQRGESMFFISQLVYKPQPTMYELLASGAVARALQLALRAKDESAIQQCIDAANMHPQTLGFAFDELMPELLTILPRLHVKWTKTDITAACKHGCGQMFRGTVLPDGTICDDMFIWDNSNPDAVISQILDEDPRLCVNVCNKLERLPPCAPTIVQKCGPLAHLTWLSLHARPCDFIDYIRACAQHVPIESLQCATPYGCESLTSLLEQQRYAIHKHALSSG